MFGLASEFYKLSVTAHSHEVAVKQARWAEEVGAEALMLLPPFFLGPSEADLRRHVLKVAGATSLPVVVQHAPAQTGVKMTAEAFLELNRRAPNVRYVKVESAPPGPLISAIDDGSGGAIKCLVGYGGLQLLDGLERGAVGVQPVSGVADYYPHILRAFDEGDLEGAYAPHADLLPLINLLMQAIEPPKSDGEDHFERARHHRPRLLPGHELRARRPDASRAEVVRRAYRRQVAPFRAVAGR
jgi:dihydrodipicolinate synthase/N-acetylneuraminate lyase